MVRSLCHSAARAVASFVVLALVLLYVQREAGVSGSSDSGDR